MNVFFGHFWLIPSDMADVCMEEVEEEVGRLKCVIIPSDLIWITQVVSVSGVVKVATNFIFLTLSCLTEKHTEILYKYKSQKTNMIKLQIRIGLINRISEPAPSETSS